MDEMKVGETEVTFKSEADVFDPEKEGLKILEAGMNYFYSILEVKEKKEKEKERVFLIIKIQSTLI